MVRDVIWTVHLANKKANAYNVVNSQGLQAYADGKVPQLRNPGSTGYQLGRRAEKDARARPAAR